MSTDQDFDRLADAWMAEGPFDLADPVLERALDEVHRTRQRPPLGRPWRIPMRNRLPLALALVAIVAIGGLVVAGLGRSSATIGTDAPSNQPTVAVPSASAPASSAASGPATFDETGTIAFSRVDADGDGTQRTWLVDPTGTNESAFRVPSGFTNGTTQLPGTGCCSVFAPDGRTMAVGFDDVRGWAGGGTLDGTAMLALDGALVAQLPVCGACAYLDGMNYVPAAWSAQGYHLALRAWNDAHASKDGIYLVEAGAPKGGAVGWQGPVTGGRRDVALAFSPDGTRLLFIRPVDLGPEDAGALYVLDLTAGHGKETRLTPPGVRVYSNGYFGTGASWSPDGTRVTYAGTDASGSTDAMRAWVVPASGGEATPISEAAPYVTTAHWSPDGRLIAYDAPGGGNGHDLIVVAPDGSGAVNLTLSFGPGVCCARWSPDSKALLAAGTTGANERSVLYIVPVDGSAIRQVTTIEGTYEDYSWGPASR
jgi:hypothetical protein